MQPPQACGTSDPIGPYAGRDRRRQCNTPVPLPCGSGIKRYLPHRADSGYLAMGLEIVAQPRIVVGAGNNLNLRWRSEEHTSELQSLMRISYAVFCLKKKK